MPTQSRTRSQLTEHNSVVAGREIKLQGLTKAWGETKALDDISLTVEAGSFTALLGPSGCGKSTALRLVSGLEEPTSGKIIIGGTDVTAMPPAQRDIAMVFQSYALFPHLSVAENIIFGLRVRGVSRSVRDEKLKATADMLGLSALLDRRPSQLSGGQQQRVALGRAIIADKSIFLMDEPLSNLDAKLRAEMREEIRALQRRLGVTMLYVTHDQVEAVTMADQVVLMNKGRIEQAAPPRTIYETPGTLFAARFIGTPPMGTFSPAVFAEHLQQPQTESLNGLTFGIRPEALQLSKTGILKGPIHHIEYLGADAMIECMIGGEPVFCRAPGHTDHKIGDTVSFALNKNDLHCFASNSGTRLAKLPTEIEALL